MADFDVVAELSRRFARWPVRLCNDATSACAAELTFGVGASYRNFAYFYVGTFIGGGIVLNGSLFPGRSGNAGALGSMPIMRREPNGDASLQQLIRTASIYRLERRLIAAGRRAPTSGCRRTTGRTSPSRSTSGSPRPPRRWRRRSPRCSR